jgi:signal transduction histidine kinase
MGVELSQWIEEHRAAIVASWAGQLRAQLGSAVGEPQLLDSLELFLDEVIEALRGSGKTAVEHGRSALARGHGRQRHTLQQSIGTVVREYGLLYEVIAEQAQQAGAGLAHGDALALSRCLFTGAAEAVEEFARKSEDEQRQAEMEASAFLAHELRNPLSAALLNWELLHKSGQLRGESAERHARSLERLADLLDRALADSRLLAPGARAPLRREPLWVEELLQEAAEECAPQAQHKRIEVLIDAEGAGSVQADARLLRSALANLVGNAVRFTRNYGTVLLHARTEGEQLRIDVEDGCGGLGPEGAEQFFEAFIEANPGRSGYGLGLAIVRQALEAHGGTLEVVNRPGAGCVFSALLPLVALEVEKPRADPRAAR